jgi:putative copper export protein
VLFETNYGHLWLLRIALILAALGLLRWTTRSQSGTSNTTSLRERRSRNRFSQLRQQVTQEQEQDRPKQASEKEEIEQGESSASKTASSPERTAEAGTMAETSREGTMAGAEPSQEGQARTTTSRALAPGLTPALSPRPRSRPASQGKNTLAELVLAGLILLTIAPSEDVAQLIQLHISAIVLNWLFLAAQCIWLGGAAYLGYVLLPLLPVTEPDRHAGTLATLLRRYTPLTLGAIGVLLVSGLFLSEASITNIQQLLTDPYGRALFVKILLLALMLILGGYALFFLRPKLTQQAILLPVVNAELPARRTRQSALEGTENSLKRTMKMQTWLGAGVLLCAALMSFFAPPIVFPPLNYAASTTSSSATSAQNIQTKRIGDLSVTLQVLPGRANAANTVVVTILDDRGNIVTNAQVQLRTNMEVMDMGTAQATAKGGNPTYTATFAEDVAFSMGGLWDISVRISRPNHAPVQGTFQVMLGE